MRRFNFGFTLVELMVTVAIAAVLAAIAVPNMRIFLVRQSVSSTADALASDFRLTRSEAIKRSARVGICASSSGTSCTGSGGLWKDGWMIYVPTASNGSFATGDEIVRVQEAPTSILSIVGDIPINTRTKIIYEPMGWAKSSDQTFIITPTGDVPAGTVRVVCVSINGRVAIRPRGDTSCT